MSTGPSREAHEEIEESGAAARQRDQITRLIGDIGPMSNPWIQDATGLSQNVVSARLGELRLDGLVMVTGERSRGGAVYALGDDRLEWLPGLISSHEANVAKLKRILAKCEAAQDRLED